MPSQEPPAPHGAGDLVRVFTRPLRAVDLVLAERARLVTTAMHGSPVLLSAVLLFTSVVFTLPYGFVLGEPWRIAVLYVGSIAICWPSLHVFTAFLGLRCAPGQSLFLALVSTAVAALFTFGFFPVLWFLTATMPEQSRVTAAHVSTLLLALALFAGLAQPARCLLDAKNHELSSIPPWLLLAWDALVLLICHRMATVLELI